MCTSVDRKVKKVVKAATKVMRVKKDLTKKVYLAIYFSSLCEMTSVV